MYSAKLLIPLLIWAHIGLGFRLVGPVSAQEPPPQGCVECHNGGAAEEVPPGLPGKLPAEYVHSFLDCIDCHESFSMDELDLSAPNPHPAGTGLADCGECHDEEAETCVNHGRLEAVCQPKGNEP